MNKFKIYLKKLKGAFPIEQIRRKIIEKINHDQTSKVGIIRQMQGFYDKVLTLQKAQHDTGKDMATVINEFKPPIFFKEKHPTARNLLISCLLVRPKTGKSVKGS